MTLTATGKSTCGTAYAFDGAIPFSLPDVSALDFGDTVRDNGGRGMRLCVNVCCACGRRYLLSTLILVPELGPCCGGGR